jgi:AraC family transcriptional activator of tynA and feaB
MSQAFHPTSQSAALNTLAGGFPLFVEQSTDGVRPNERLDFWRDGVLRRIEPIRFLQSKTPFAGQVRAIRGHQAELMQHSSDAVIGVRARDRIARDDLDHIGIDLMVACGPVTILDQHGQHRVRSGDLLITDYGQPLRVIRSRHRSISIMLPRIAVSEALGASPELLAGRSIGASGMAAVLRSHMRASIDEASRMTPRQRALAVNVAVDMALATLQAELSSRIDVERFSAGFYQAARQVIARGCCDPNLTAEAVAAKLGCSRATLYRVFAPYGESVAALIWAARLRLASRLLASPRHRHMLVADIAFNCGFSEPSSFNRMFKRRFGMTPRDARARSNAPEVANSEFIGMAEP